MSKVQGNVEVIVVSMWWCRMTSACTNTRVSNLTELCNLKGQPKPGVSFPLSYYTSKCNTYTSLCHNITMQGFFFNPYITKFRECPNKNVYTICLFKLWYIYIDLTFFVRNSLKNNKSCGFISVLSVNRTQLNLI